MNDAFDSKLLHFDFVKKKNAWRHEVQEWQHAETNRNLELNHTANIDRQSVPCGVPPEHIMWPGQVRGPIG